MLNLTCFVALQLPADVFGAFIQTRLKIIHEKVRQHAGMGSPLWAAALLWL